MLKPDLIIHPQSGDTERAADILDEIFAVLRKHNCALIHTPDQIVLAKVGSPVGHNARVLAHVRQITPDFIESKEIDWTPKGLRTQ